MSTSIHVQHRRLLGRSVLVASFASLAGGACLPAEPPHAPAVQSGPAAQAAPAKMTLTPRYQPAFALVVRLDDRPVAGTVRVAKGKADPIVQESPRTPGYGTPRRDPLAGAISLTVDSDGLAPVDEPSRRALSDGTGTFAVYIDGKGYDYVPAPGTNPFKCAAVIEMLDAKDACTDDALLRAAMNAPPAWCDDGGKQALAAVLDAKRAATEACWTKLDEETLTRVSRLSPASVRDAGCAKLVALVKFDTEVTVLQRVVDTCPNQATPEQKDQLAKAKEAAAKADAMKRLDASYDKAKQGTSREMEQFYSQFYSTGDPRVEEVRKLAAQKFGPQDPARFKAARRRVSAMSNRSFLVSLCDIKDGKASIDLNFTLESATAGAVGFFFGGDQAMANMARVSKAHEISERNIRATAKSSLGVKDAEVGRCSSPHWYLNDRPWPPKTDAPVAKAPPATKVPPAKGTKP